LGSVDQSLIYRCRELGRISDTSARRAHQRLHNLNNVGLFAPQKVTGFPGETASLLAKAFDLACEHGLLTMPVLARQL
jgi:hypothetical protein